MMPSSPRSSSMSVGGAISRRPRARTTARTWSGSLRDLALLATIGVAMVAARSARVDAQRPPIPPTKGTPRVTSPSTNPPVPVDADSAKGDGEAFASLPEPVLEVLDVRRQLQPWDGDPGLTCVPLSTTSDGSRRQRVQGRLADARALVVFARVDRRGALRRVEFVRRLPNGGQAGFTWDAEGDVTTRTDWPPGLTNPSSHPVPRGSPIPRALRGLGRLVMAWPCAATS